MQAHRSTRLCRFLVVLLLAQPLLAFQSPLSDESLREAYFLGQRRDGSLEKLAESYSRRFTPPQTGPYISAVILATPFLTAAQSSSKHTPTTAHNRLRRIIATPVKKRFRSPSKFSSRNPTVNFFP